MGVGGGRENHNVRDLDRKEKETSETLAISAQFRSSNLGTCFGA